MKRRTLAILLLTALVSAPIGAGEAAGRVLANTPGEMLDDVARAVYEFAMTAAELVLPAARQVVPSSSEGEADPTCPAGDDTVPPATQESHPQIDPWG